MTHPHVPAAFINAIAEEGTTLEAVAHLQKQWNETCALRDAFDAFSKAVSMRGGPSLAVQQHNPSWEAWKKLSDAFGAARRGRTQHENNRANDI